MGLMGFWGFFRSAIIVTDNSHLSLCRVPTGRQVRVRYVTALRLRLVRCYVRHRARSVSPTLWMQCRLSSTGRLRVVVSDTALRLRLVQRYVRHCARSVSPTLWMQCRLSSTGRLSVVVSDTALRLRLVRCYVRHWARSVSPTLWMQIRLSPTLRMRCGLSSTGRLSVVVTVTALRLRLVRCFLGGSCLH